MLLYGFGDFLLENGVLLLRPPIRYLRQALLSEEFVEGLVLPLVLGEEQQEIFDSALLESAREMVDRLFGEIGAEDDGDNVSRHIWITRKRASSVLRG